MTRRFNAQNAQTHPYIPTIYRYLLTEVLEPLRLGKEPNYTRFNWGGGRLCGKTFTAIAFGVLLWTLLSTQKVGIYIIRKEVQNRIEAWETARQTLPTWGNFKFNKNDKTIIAENLFIEVIGIAEQSKDKVQKLGKTRRNHDIQVLVFDEATQFEEQDFGAVQAALGAGQVTLVFKTANPIEPASPFFVDFKYNNPYDLGEMRTNGQHVLYQPEEKTVWHWVNPLAIWKEGLINEETKRWLLAIPSNDHRFGETYLFGKPANLMGGVFSDGLPFAQQVKELPFNVFDKYKSDVFGGMDLGYNRDPTVLLIGVISPDEKRVCIVDELYIDNKLRSFDQNRIGYDVMNFVEKVWKKLLWRGVITVYVDNNFAFIQSLNEIVARDKRLLKYGDELLRLKHLVYFESISEHYKKRRINDRIHGINNALHNSCFWYIRCPNLIKEFSMYHYKIDRTGVPATKPVDIYNHSIDALGYLLHHFIDSIGLIDW